MNVEWLPIGELKPNPINPNKHSKDQIERLQQLIEYYGWRHPIIVSKETGLVVVGHGRLEAAKSMGLTEVPVSIQSFESSDQEYGFMVADNAIASWAELDLANINLEMPNLGPDFDIDLLGIKDFEIESADKFTLDPIEKSLKDKSLTLEATFPNENEMMTAYEDLCAKGYIVKIKYV